MAGTVRTFNQQVREHIWKEMESTCDIATIYGAQAELVREAGYPATINDESVARVMHGAAVDLIGADNVLAINPRMAAEDFAFFAQVKPAAFMLLGVELPGDRRNHHRNDFDLEESKLYVGTAIMAETVLRLMTA